MTEQEQEQLDLYTAWQDAQRDHAVMRMIVRAAQFRLIEAQRQERDARERYYATMPPLVATHMDTEQLT